jgi:hypothetical protein
MSKIFKLNAIAGKCFAMVCRTQDLKEFQNAGKDITYCLKTSIFRYSLLEINASRITNLGILL